MSDCKSSGKTENEAVEKLQKLLQERLTNSKIVTLEIEPSQTENPWMKVAGMHKDNPLFDEVVVEIEAERTRNCFEPLLPESLEVDLDDEVELDPSKIERPLDDYKT